MTYALDVLPQAQHDLAQLDPPLRRRIGKRIDWLAEHAKDIKHESLAGEWARSKFRVGDYRIVYKIASATLLRASLPDRPKHGILELEGLAAETWHGVRAQEYVAQERAAWDG